ncbi:hypothetical protein AAC387_Pa07g2304 [Persea americana]
MLRSILADVLRPEKKQFQIFHSPEQDRSLKISSDRRRNRACYFVLVCTEKQLRQIKEFPTIPPVPGEEGFPHSPVGCTSPE